MFLFGFEQFFGGWLVFLVWFRARTRVRVLICFKSAAKIYVIGTKVDAGLKVSGLQ